MNEPELIPQSPQTESRDPGQLIMFFSFALLMLGFSTIWVFFNLSHVQILTVVFGIAFFAIAFFSIRLGLVLMAISMLFSPEFSVGSIGARDIAIRIEDVLIPILTLAWLAQVTIRRQWGMFSWTPLNKPIFLLIIVSIFSTIRGSLTGWVSPLTGTFYVFKTLEFFSIYFLTVNYVREEKQIKYFLFFILLVAGFLGLYTLKQVPTTQIFSSNRITAPFEGQAEPATVGGYMAFLIIIIVSILLYERNSGLKILYGLLIAIMLVPFLFTLNRASYIALIGGGVFVGVLSRKKWFNLFLLFLLVSSPVWAPPAVKERIAFTWEDARNPGRTLGVDYSLQERFYAYRRMWPGFKESPLIGWGVTSWQTPDSQWARTLHEIGIVGLAFWIWIFTRLFKSSYWLFRRQDAGIMKGMALGYCAALLGIILHGFGAITLYIVRIMEPFWFVSGLITSMYLLKIKEIKDG